LSILYYGREVANTKRIREEERKLGFGWNREQLFEAVPNVKSVPQIFIDEKYVGGFDDLVKYFNEVK